MLAESAWIAPLRYFQLVLDQRKADYEEILRLLIGNVSSYLEKYLGHAIISATYTHDGTTWKKLDGNGRATYYLAQRPLGTLTSLALKDESAIDITDVDELVWEADNAALHLLNGRVFTRGKQNLAVTYVAGWTTYAADVTTTPTIPGEILQVGAELIGRKLQEWERKGPQITEVRVADTAVAFTLSDMTAEQRRMLAPYRRYLIA
ncbi:MAG: hypothetical protein KKD44_27295 [Proteobacteria bacterium]|nr:hypothetical protein [Pseudomonadota bacterium]